MQDIFTTDGIALFPKSPRKGGDTSHYDWGQAFITLGKALSSLDEGRWLIPVLVTLK